MSTGKLKAQYNRVRTSVALQANSMWTKTIGLAHDTQAGSNAVIEASLKAPTHGGRGREARREAAKALMEEAGYEPAVTSFEGLVALARAQGSIGGPNRGACKVCGGMGHMTKRCKNHLSSFYRNGDGGGNGEVGLPLVREESEISSLSSNVSSEAEEDGKKHASRKKRRRKTEGKKSGHRKEEGNKRKRKSSDKLNRKGSSKEKKSKVTKSSRTS